MASPRHTRSNLGGAASVAAVTTALGTTEPGQLSTPAAGIPPVGDQAEAMRTAVELTGNSTASGAAAEDVTGSAREAPGVGSGAAGANVPGDLVAERGAFHAFRSEHPADFAEFEGMVREAVREEVQRMLESFPAAGGIEFLGATPGAWLTGRSPKVEDFDLEITSKVDGFRRGGVSHPSAPTPRRSSDFTDGQLRQIMTEPNLFVRRV